MLNTPSLKKTKQNKKKTRKQKRKPVVSLLSSPLGKLRTERRTGFSQAKKTPPLNFTQLISDSPYKNRAMWAFDWQSRKNIGLIPIATKFGPQEVDSLNQLQGSFQSPTIDMLYATMFWKLTKIEGDAVKNLWRLWPSKNTFGDEFRPNMSFTMNLKAFWVINW